MHRILMRGVYIDVPSHLHERELAFWTTALLAKPVPEPRYPEYHSLTEAAALEPVQLQNIGDAPARFHIDIETDDVPAESARLIAAGASQVGGRDDWVVLRDPAGLAFCVVPAGSDDFAARARDVVD
jgi:hypothetical protein